MSPYSGLVDLTTSRTSSGRYPTVLYKTTHLTHFSPAPMAQWLYSRYWVRISVPAQTQSGFLKVQWVGVWPLHPLLSH